MYTRNLDVCPEKLVSHGKCVFGAFEAHPKRLDIRGISRAYLDLPIPKFLTNLRINSRLTFFFNDEEYIGSIDFFDAKIFGLVQVVFWNKSTKQRYFYRSVMGPKKRLVPHSMEKAATSSFKKSRFVRISWDRSQNKMSVKFNLKGNSVLPSVEGKIRTTFPESTENELTLVLPAPTLRRGSARYYGAFPLTGNLVFTQKNDEPKKISLTNGLSFLDINRTYMKFVNQTEFLTGLGYINGREISFRIETGSQDSVDGDKYNGNALFFDNKKTLLPPVVITHTYGIMKTWNIQDTENMIDLTFSPISVDNSIVNAIMFRANYNTIYGTFSGVLMTSEGEKINVNRLPGLAKKSFIRL